MTLLWGWLIHRLRDADCCSNKLDLLWLDSKCNFLNCPMWCCELSATSLLIFAFIWFSLWCFICILLFWMNLWGQWLKWQLRPSLPVPVFLMKYSVLGRDAEINWTELQVRCFQRGPQHQLVCTSTLLSRGPPAVMCKYYAFKGPQRAIIMCK